MDSEKIKNAIMEERALYMVSGGEALQVVPTGFYDEHIVTILTGGVVSASELYGSISEVKLEIAFMAKRRITCEINAKKEEIRAIDMEIDYRVSALARMVIENMEVDGQ